MLILVSSVKLKFMIGPEGCTGKILAIVLVARRYVLDKSNRASVGVKKVNLKKYVEAFILTVGIGFVKPPLLPGLGPREASPNRD